MIVCFRRRPATGAQQPGPRASSPAGRNPYDPKLKMNLRVSWQGLDGHAASEQDNTKWGSVSRHGLLQAGITCPYCGREAARTGEFNRIHTTRFGEAIVCIHCLAVLLASPDDDVDPVKPGAQYDETIYHTFAISGRQRTIGQKLSGATPVLGDWVVIVSKRLVVGGTRANPTAPTNYFGTEGRVDSVLEDGRYTIALGGNHGIGGAGSAPESGLGGSWGTFDRDEIRVMVLPILRAGDRVRIMTGPGCGQTGSIAVAGSGSVELVTESGAPMKLPIERVEKIVADEQVV